MGWVNRDLFHASTLDAMFTIMALKRIEDAG
jgi:hypothetical protein